MSQAGPSAKRKQPLLDYEYTGKRARCVLEHDQEPIIVEPDDDDLDLILARIQEQDASEALARKLQNEWNGVGSSSDPIVLDNTENDEALARQLAEEWNEQEVILLDDSAEHDLGGQIAASENFEEQSLKLNDLDDQVFDIHDLEDPEIEASPADSPSPTSSTPLTSIQGQYSTGETSAYETRRLAPSKIKLGVSSLTDQNLPPNEKLAQFRELFTAERDCSKCGQAVCSPRGHVMFTTGDLLPPSLTALLHAPCSSCCTNHCRGCFTPIACPISCKGSSKNSQCSVDSCCAEGRAIALFEALGGFDRQYLGERATSDSRALAAMANRNHIYAKSVGPGGTGYASDSGYGLEYGSGWRRGSQRGRGRGKSTVTERRNMSRADELAAHWEEIVVRALKTLTELLPSPYSDSAKVYDMLPHASIGPLLSLSQLPELLGALLRNDSITDWIARSDTYHAVVSLLRRMVDCELTVQVLIGQRSEMNKSCGLEEWMWGDGDITWVEDKDGQIERAPPLYEHFKKLTRQCEAFLAGASQMVNESEGTEEDVHEATVKTTSLCGDIIAARDDIDRAMAVLGTAVSLDKLDSLSDESSKVHVEHEHFASGSKSNNPRNGKGHDPSIDMEKAYAQACERLAFKYVLLSDDMKGKGKGLSYGNYNYKRDLTVTESATRNPKDRLHLVKELAVMATSLPPGVWVRVDEVRNDVIKIMIAGPDDTPYAGGLFEFDCLMPIEYPHKPPQMHLRTTGGGTVRFNPNLYNDGKVCLSLLGTWPGRPEEQWSNKSTLLQVVVSIQSMILIDAPYFNEPGHGQANVKAAASIAYNRETSLQTVRWAIVDWLKDEHRDGVWRDVIASHFGIRQAKIRKQIADWAATNNWTTNRANRNVTYGDELADHFTTIYNRPAMPSAKSLDLVREFDMGIERIQKWGTDTRIGDC